ncbi:MAG: aminotransferase class I/II-fold pyridoxal phosphate-dependent enzyme [Bacteroidales bacterium]|nr:aminotransferase class I/II-fold pyridoxal phosphate-dependent enzyme [Bacteroidales bacterium]
MNTLPITPAKRLGETGAYYFATKLKEIREMDQSTQQVINLGIGNPDLPPDNIVVNTLQQTIRDPHNHGYQPYSGIPELRRAFAAWYKKWFKVSLNPDLEILPLMGSKEGLMHIAMSFLDPGDVALVPDPGYPAYHTITQMTGGIPVTYPLTVENNWLPDLNQLEDSTNLHAVKLMWLNYPHMPTGGTATTEFFNRLVQFALKHHILLINDNPYSFILNDHPLSLLAAKDAQTTAVELNSLSKSHQMAGWRIGMIAGHPSYIQTVLRFKSQMDSGMFKPMQMAAVKALRLEKDWYLKINKVYQSRQQLVFQLMDQLNCTYQTSRKGLFVWARIPEKETSGQHFSERLLKEQRIFITPGFIFGSQGDRYIRASLCQPEEIIREAIERVVGY